MLGAQTHYGTMENIKGKNEAHMCFTMHSHDAAPFKSYDLPASSVRYLKFLSMC
jgi:hypothetical protein